MSNRRLKMKQSEMIKQLQENAYPFGLWPEKYDNGIEMQEMAEELGKHMEVYNTNWAGIGLPIQELEDPNSWVLRLRPDYSPEQEIEKCEILPPDDEGIMWVQRSRDPHENLMDFDSCLMHADFVGFEVDGVIFGRVYKRKSDGYHAAFIAANELDKYDVCDMTTGKALFRKAR
jgi:hypothetical protein